MSFELHPPAYWKRGGVYGLTDRFEGQFAFTQRASARSRRIILSADRDLGRHQRWLQRHRTVWTKEFSAALHLVKRKQVIWRFERLSRDLLLASRYGISWLFQQVLATSRGQLARGPLQESIDKLPEQSEPRAGATDRSVKTLRERPPSRKAKIRHRVFKLFQTRVKSRGVRWGLAAFTAALLIGAAFRATTPNSFAPEHANTAANPAPAEVLLQIGLPKITERLLPESFGLTVLRSALPEPLSMPSKTVAEMISVTTPLTPSPAAPDAFTAPNATTSVPSLASSGFNVLRPAFPKPLSMPARTVAEMMLMAQPLILAGMKSETTAPVSHQSFARAPKVKPKLNRELPIRDAEQQVNSWFGLPWIPVR